MSLLNFSSLLKEAIDKQKQDVNNELHSDDASKGNKVYATYTWNHQSR